MTSHERYLEECLRRLSREFAEKRSDICESIDSILDNYELKDVKIHSESRYTHFNYQGSAFLYDSLTTLVDTDGTPNDDENDGIGACGWTTLKCEYSNDED
jgi:hypothetical protein